MSVEDSRHYRMGDHATDARTEGLLQDSNQPLAILCGRPLLSNKGIPLNREWINQVRVNTSAVERRAQTHVARRTVKKEWQAAWLLRGVSGGDRAAVSGVDADGRVGRRCAKGRDPPQAALERGGGIVVLEIKVAAGLVHGC